jgi:HAD superfamily hydrolase (TIGR01509 family)
MLRALIFDFDGLILDTETPEYTAWCEVYAARGASLALETWQAAIGTRDGFDPYAHLASLIGRPVDRVRTRAEVKQRALELIETLSPLPGVLELLAEARGGGLAIALASSSDHEWIDGHLGRLALAHHFDAVVCASTDGLPAKPEPAVYLEALRRLEVPAHEAIALEDSFNGVTAATRAGIHCIAVPNTVTRTMDFSHANACHTSLEELSLTRLRQALG